MTDRTDQPVTPAGDRPSEHDAELAAAQVRIDALTEELEATNRGIIALHTELDAARAAEARALAEQEVAAERDRIAQDLHSRVIQKVFSAGLDLQGLASLSQQPQLTRRIRTIVADLDAVITELRASVFGDHDRPEPGPGLRARLNELTVEAHRPDFSVGLGFRGPIDDTVPEDAAADLLEAARFALSELGVHATGAEVLVEAGADLTLSLDYDGPVPQDAIALNTLRERAEARGGSLRIATADARTSLTWSIPLKAADGTPEPSDPAL